MRIPLSPEWTDAFIFASGMQLASFNSQNLANIVWALATLQRQPDEGWVRDFLAVSRAQLGSFTPQNLANVVWALATLQRQPDEGWVRDFLAASRTQLGSFTPQGLANVVWALATLQRQPDEGWALDFLAASRTQLGSFKPQGFAIVVWALATLQRQPDEGWARDFLAASRTQLSSFKPQGLASVVWALATLQRQPDEGWARDFLDQVLLCCFPAIGKHGTYDVHCVPIVWACMSLGLLRAHPRQCALLWEAAVACAAAAEPAGSRSSNEQQDLAQLLDVSVFVSLTGEGREHGIGGLSPQLLHRCQQAQALKRDADVSSRAEAEVAVALRLAMEGAGPQGVTVASAFLCERSQRVVDVALLPPAAASAPPQAAAGSPATGVAGGALRQDKAGGTGFLPVAVEVDGPSHYLLTVPGGKRVPTGKTALRDRCLSAAGWRVVSVPWFEWADLGRGTTEDEKRLQRVAYLQRKLGWELLQQ